MHFRKLYFAVVEVYHRNCTASCINAVKSISLLRKPLILFEITVVSMQIKVEYINRDDQQLGGVAFETWREPFEFILFIRESEEYKLISSDQTGSENTRGHPPDVFIVRPRPHSDILMFHVVFAEIGCIRIYSKEPTGSKIAKTNKYKIFSHVYYSWINTSISNISGGGGI